jgi:hypothetical protein
MRNQILLVTIVGLVTLAGCDGPSQRGYYNYEYRSSNYYPASHYSGANFYDPTGDPAYSYYPAYSPIPRESVYTPGRPGYDYSYYNYGDNY